MTFANADAMVFINCAERGTEMAETLMDHQEITIRPQPNNPGVPVMKRMCIIANTTDMPAAACEASIFTGITIAEYLRDMG